MKRWMWMVSLVLAAVLGLTACGSGNNDETEQTETITPVAAESTGPVFTKGVEHEDLLRPLYEHWAKGEETAAKNLMRTEEYIAMAAELADTDGSYYFGQIDDEGRRSGKGVAVYGSGYYYLGEWAEDVRSGTGLWVLAHPMTAENPLAGSETYHGDEIWYQGGWAADLPQGEGMVYQSSVMPLTDAAGYVEGYFLHEATASGTFAAGCYDGEFIMRRNPNGTWIEYGEVYVMGVAQPLHNPPQYHWNDTTQQQYVTAEYGEGEKEYGWGNRVIAVPGLGIGTWG